MKRTTLFIISISAAALLLTACGQTQTAAMANSPSNAPQAPVSQSDRNVISVTSSEEVKVAPDVTEIVYSVTTQAPDAEECQKKNSESIDKVMAVIKEFGVEDKSVQTTAYYMNPIYDYKSSTQKITGYEIRTSLTIADLPIDQTGSLLSKSVSAGVNNIESISYKSSQYEESYQEALKLALEAARAKAETLAAAGGCSVGAVAGITEHMGNNSFRYTDYALSSRMASTLDGAVEDVAVMPGEVAVNASVTVEYYIQ